MRRNIFSTFRVPWKKISLFGVRYIFYSVVWSLVGDLMLALFCRSGNKKAVAWSGESTDF